MPNKYDSSNKMKGMPMNHDGMPMHSGAPHMESAKQERKNLMDDNPVTRTAAGDRPWIAKHYKSGINYGHESSPASKHGSMAHKAGPGDLDGDGKMSSYEANRQEAIEKAMAKKGSSNRMDHK